jgi:AAA domain/Toprim-like
MMPSAEQIAQALGGEVSAGQICAPAPGHSPADRGMCVKIEPDAPDGFIVNLFNGGDPIAAKRYVRQKLGLPAWKPNGNGNGHAYTPPGERLAATELQAADFARQCADVAISTTAKTAVRTLIAKYDYRDLDGALLYEVLRYKPKSFAQRAPNGTGGYSYKLDGVPRVLYRLPELMQFPSATVFICEGEKDADAVAALGLSATTISGGTRWAPELAAPLKGRDVFIMPDNDAHGMKRAEEAAIALQGIAGSIRIVELPGLPDKDDISNWLDAGHTKEQLEQICLAAPEWQPQPATEVMPANLGEWDAGDDEADPPPRGWLLGNIFCRQFVSSLIADGGVGKTALRLLQLLSLAIGRALTGEFVFVRCRVLIISLEDNADELRRRLKAAMLHFGIQRSELKGWLYLASLRASDGKLMVLDEHGRPVAGPLAAKLAHTVESRKIDIVSIDPFIKSHSVEENGNSVIDVVMQMLANMADQFDIAIDVPHHAAKGPADPGNANRGRGASSMKDGARLVYTLTPMSPEEGQAFGLAEEARRLLIRMDSAKVNITPPMAEAKWFRLVGVDIGNASELYPHGDQVQTVEPWTPPDAFAGMGNLTLNLILNDIEAGMPDGNRYSDAPKVVDRAAWRVIVKHCPDKDEAAARQIIKAWTKSGLLVGKECENPVTRKTVKGLFVDNQKRPS